MLGRAALRALSLAVVLLSMRQTTAIGESRMHESWQELTSLGGKQSRMSIAHWPYDKYPSTPEITPKSRTTLIDADGPGVVSAFHVSAYRGEPNTSADLILRVWYDNEPKPAIEMPWLDFLGDIGGRSGYFSTIYFSKVKESHNFRLPMPFRKHIRMEVENPTDTKFMGYTEVQWERIPSFPESSGMLRVDYRTGKVRIPQEIIELCNIRSKGAIVAHWLQLQSDHPSCKEGGVMCEGNTEFYFDGKDKPDIESLGTEDFYGHSWGFTGLQSDNYCAIVRQENLPSGGGLVAMLRCRALDRVSFDRSCRVVADYTQEFYSDLSRNPRHAGPTGKLSFDVLYKSCFYFYSAVPGDGGTP